MLSVDLDLFQLDTLTLRLQSVCVDILWMNIFLKETSQ